MNFGNVLGDIGNFFGGMFGGNQKKKEERKQPTIPASIARPVAQQQRPAGGIQLPQEMLIKKPVATAPPKLSGVTLSSNNSYKGLDVGGLNDADRTAAKAIIDKGGSDPSKFISAAREAQKLSTKSAYENSIPGKVLNTGGAVARTIAGGIFGGLTDMGSRVVETADQAGTAALRVIDKADPYLTDQMRQSRIQNDTARFKGYNDFRRGTSDITKTITGDPTFDLKAETDREALAIASGTATPGEVFSAAMKSIDLAGIAPVAKFIPSAATELAPMIKSAATSVAELPRGLVNAAEDRLVANNPTAGFIDRSVLKDAQAQQKITNAQVQADWEAGVAQRKAAAVREPNSPITQSPTTNKAPAITSANPNHPSNMPEVAPAPVQPLIPAQPVVSPPPVMSGVELPAAPVMRPEMPVVEPTVPVMTPDELTAQAQAAIEQLSMRPVEQPAPILQAPAEAPSTTQARTMAAQVTNVDQGEVSAAIKAAELNNAPAQAVATIERPTYVSPVKGGRAGTSGDGKASYNTGDSTLDAIVNDSIISHKGTAKTAVKRAEALNALGISADKQTAIRNVAVKTVDKQTGRISQEGTDAINRILTAPARERPTVAAPRTIEAPKATRQSAPVQKTVEIPAAATPAELGKMGQNAVQSGKKMSDDDWTKLSTDIGEAANTRATELNTDMPSILEKVQRAYDTNNLRVGKIKSAKQAGLTENEFDLYTKMTNEMDYVRARADPSLLTGGRIERWYSPRQTTDTEFDPTLVNERRRGASSDPVPTGSLDLTTVPVEQYIRRYGNAESVVKESMIESVETAFTKGADGVETSRPSGIKVSDEAKARLEEGAKAYVAKKDDIEYALANSTLDTKAIEDIAREMDDGMDATFKELMDEIPKDTAEGREAIARLTSQRGAYMQSTIRSNMFSNVVNRSMDQVQSALIKSTNVFMGIADSTVSIASGSKVLSSGRAASSVARQYSKGALLKQIGKDFRTNMAFGSKSVASGVDTAYRAGSTALTSAGDLTTQTVRTANRAILARAQAEGITKRSDLEKYLRENINSAEYKELLQGVQDVYAGYTSMPSSAGSRTGRNGQGFSKIDNAIANSETLKAVGVSPRVRRELNDLIMPVVSGFAGATYRVGAKSLNAAMLGVPGMVKGLKLAKEGGETSRQLGQIMISRSLIDGVVGGTAAAATIGALVANAAEWTGSYPSDPNERARWEKQGITENALSFDLGNGETLQIQPGRLLGAFALPVVLPAVIKSGGNVGDVLDATMGQMLNNLGVESILQNVGNISTAITGSGNQREQAVKQLINSAGFSASSVVPASGLLNNVGNLADNTKRDTSGNFLKVIANRNPVTRPLLDAKKDNLGNDVRNNTQLSLGSQVATAGKNGKASSNASASVDPVNDEINRLAESDFEVTPSQDVENANAQTDAGTLLKSKLYKEASDEKKAEYMAETLLGTKMKDINKSLSPAQRSTLIEHELQSADEREKWRDNNDNAANWYQADYDNAKANKTLSAEDDDLQNKSGKLYRAGEAKVNQELGADYALKALYDDISQTDFKDMLDPDSENYDAPTATKLYEYDQARTKAGVSGAKFTDRAKFALKGTGKGGGSGSGTGSKNFAFASLPSSLVGTGSGGSGGNSGYAKDAPLFTPIADLKAPATIAIPKGRTISVKKGIQL